MPDASSKPQTLREVFAEAIALPISLLLIAGFLVCGFHVGFHAVHLPTFVQSRGRPSWVAVTAPTLAGIATILGTCLSGRWARRCQKPRGPRRAAFPRP